MIVVIESIALAPKAIHILQCASVLISRPSGKDTGVAVVEVACLSGDTEDTITVDVGEGDEVFVYSSEGGQIYGTHIA